MVIYEVNVEVDEAVAAACAAWMEEHIRQMLTFDGFEGARWYAMEPAEGRQRWVIHYQLRDRAALEDYLARHAAAMRAEGLQRFGEHFTAARRVLEARSAYQP